MDVSKPDVLQPDVLQDSTIAESLVSSGTTNIFVPTLGTGVTRLGMYVW